MDRKDEIIASMARTLHLMAWADAAERDDGEWTPDPATCAGAGRDWQDTVPKGASRAAREMAASLAAKLTSMNDATVDALADDYLEAGGRDDARFAHSLAMLCLGSGVTPEDDVRHTSGYCNPLHPTVEFYYFSAEDAATS